MYLIDKIKKIFQAQYKTKLYFLTVQDLSQNEFFLWNQYKKPFKYVAELNQTFFPIFNAKHNLKALIKVKSVLKEDKELFKEMADFLHLTLTLPLRLQEKKEEQDFKEDILSRLTADPKKIIPFKIRSL